MGSCEPDYGYEDQPAVRREEFDAAARRYKQSAFGDAKLAAALAPSGVGDLNSDAKGSGARFNTGKPALELIPYTLIGRQLRGRGQPALGDVFCELGAWQAGGGTEHLYDLLSTLEGDWDDCARVFEYGMKKYKAWNWAKGMAWSIPLACAGRHLLAMSRGERTDPESGEPHHGHVRCNVVMLLTYASTFPEGDDRPPAELFKGLT